MTKKIIETYDNEQDNFNKHTPVKMRRIRLTLNHLNKLRRKRELNRLETELRQQRLEKIYGPGEEGMDSSPMF